MLPSFREAVGSVIGVESVMMVLPTANPEQELTPPNPPKKRRLPKHKRAKSYDATTTRSLISAQEQQSLSWDEFAMGSANISPPLKEMWNPVKIEDDHEEPPSQRRRISEDEMAPYSMSNVGLYESPPSPTPRSGDALIAGLLLSPEYEEDLAPRRENSTESLISVLDSFIPRLGHDLMSPCRGDLMSPCRGDLLENSELLDMMNDTRASVWGPNAVSC